VGAEQLPRLVVAEVLPYFKRCESWEKGEKPGGAATARSPSSAPAIAIRCSTAGSTPRREADWPFTEDYNGQEPEGFGLGQWTIKNGRRCSAAVASSAAGDAAG